MDDNMVVIVAAGSAWPLYQTCDAYVCPVGRTFRDAGRLGFYSGRTIHGIAARIEHVEPSVEMSEATAAQLCLSLDPRERRVGEAVQAAVANGYNDVPHNQVLLLSGPKSRATVTFTPIRHEGPHAFVMSKTYRPLADLLTATTTADIP